MATVQYVTLLFISTLRNAEIQTDPIKYFLLKFRVIFTINSESYLQINFPFLYYLR